MCLTPMTISDKNKIQHKVPCSKCALCVARRASAWSFRLTQEDKNAYSSLFITLTYGKGKDSNGVDYPRKSENNLYTLDKRDLQLFFKRLRQAHRRKYKKLLRQHKGAKLPQLRYYAVGEYGGATRRPHYHILLFNSDDTLIEKAWSYGSVWYGTVTGASIGYCLKYISKGKSVPQHQRDDRQKEFSVMSKGIGATYLTTQMKNWHKANHLERVYATIEDGKKISLPRYYKDRIFTPEQRGEIKGHFEKILFKESIEYNNANDYTKVEAQSVQRTIAANNRMLKQSTNNEKL